MHTLKESVKCRATTAVSGCAYVWYRATRDERHAHSELRGSRFRGETKWLSIRGQGTGDRGRGAVDGENHVCMWLKKKSFAGPRGGFLGWCVSTPISRILGAMVST